MSEVKEITEEDFRKLLDRYPRLNAGGATRPVRKNALRVVLAEEFRRDRKELEGSFEKVVEVVEWLRKNTVKQSRFSRSTSYGLKHAAERDLGYVTNGVFIAAALLCGYKIEKGAYKPRLNLRLTEETEKRLGWDIPIRD